jgi:hypothetical protein
MTNFRAEGTVRWVTEQNAVPDDESEESEPESELVVSSVARTEGDLTICASRVISAGTPTICTSKLLAL